jgi:hypothetical protein
MGLEGGAKRDAAGRGGAQGGLVRQRAATWKAIESEGGEGWGGAQRDEAWLGEANRSGARRCSLGKALGVRQHGPSRSTGNCGPLELEVVEDDIHDRDGEGRREQVHLGGPHRHMECTNLIAKVNGSKQARPRVWPKVRGPKLSEGGRTETTIVTQGTKPINDTSGNNCEFTLNDTRGWADTGRLHHV